MRRKVATEERIWPRSSELRKPTETPVERATCARDRPRRVRKRRKRCPGREAASAGRATGPWRFRTFTIAAGVQAGARRTDNTRRRGGTPALHTKRNGGGVWLWGRRGQY